MLQTIKKERRIFYEQLENIISELDYSSFVLIGDFIAITSSELDKKELLRKEGKVKKKKAPIKKKKLP